MLELDVHSTSCEALVDGVKESKSFCSAEIP